MAVQNFKVWLDDVGCFTKKHPCIVQAMFARSAAEWLVRDLDDGVDVSVNDTGNTITVFTEAPNGLVTRWEVMITVERHYCARMIGND